MGKRDLSIDFLRATVIILMTSTHINALLYTGSNIFLQKITTYGVILCFSTFLFCSAYVTALKITKGRYPTLKDSIKRILEIYITYLALGIFVSFVLNKGISLTDIFNIALLKNVPEFTEFLIAFIFFTFIPLLLPKNFWKILKKPILLILITLLIYISGNLIYIQISKHSYPYIFQIPLENIFGYRDLHRFPLTFYLPIYTFGILMSRYSKERIFILISSISFVLLQFLLFFDLAKWNRWPPSFLFLLYSFVYIPLVLLLYKRFSKSLSKGFFKHITNIGMYPLEQFFLSTLLIFLVRLIFVPSDNIFLVLIATVSIFTILLIHPLVFHRKMV